MLKRLSLSTVLLITSLNVLAIPTVSEVENTISKGDYNKAKSQLEEVLKVNPNSFVANNYMLEILKIEYAGSLQPSVSYKIYENKINQILNDKLKAKQLKEKLEEEARAKESSKKFWSVVKAFLTFIFLSLISIGLFLFFRSHWIKSKEFKKKRKEEQDWKNSANEKFIDISNTLNKYLESLDSSSPHYTNTKLLLLDNEELMEAVLVNNNYNKDMANQHFRDAYNFIDSRGL